MKTKSFCYPVLHRICLLALLLAVVPAIAQTRVIPLPLTGPAYQLAQEAYRASSRGDYREALARLQEAIRLRPDAMQLRRQLRQTREQQSAARQVRDAGYADAGAAYRAFGAHRFGQAVQLARQAVAKSPGNGAYWLLLGNALIEDHQYDDAQQALADGIAASIDPAPLQQREIELRRALVAAALPPQPPQPPQDPGYEAAQLAYGAMQDKDYDNAIAHVSEAIRRAPDNSSYRRLQISALVAAQHWSEAEQAIDDLIGRTSDAPGALFVQRGDIRQHRGDARGAQADYRTALAQGDLAPASEIDLLARTGQQQQAHARFFAARDGGALDQLDDLQLAYLAQRVGEDSIAQQGFTRADEAGQLSDAALPDAAYSAVRNGDDRSALGWFRRAIDADLPARGEQQLLDTRRSVSTIDREFGFIASLSRNGGGPSAGSGQPGASGRDSTWQAGAEAYWRPFGYMNGRTVEVFARVFQTLRDASGGATGAQTAQATVGARWKPWASQNIVVSLGTLVPLGDQASSDWLAQVAYSDGIGTEMRSDRPAWWTTQWYAEAGRYFQHPQSYGVASLQTGRSIRLDSLSSDLVLFPHLTVNADYNSLNSHRTALGAGPGLNLRYWFRQDRYHAPRSYLDLSLQYRFKLSGDERARGFFLSTTLSY